MFFLSPSLSLSFTILYGFFEEKEKLLRTVVSLTVCILICSVLFERQSISMDKSMVYGYIARL